MKLSDEDIDKIVEKVVNKLIDSKYSKSKINDIIDKKFSEDTRLSIVGCIESKVEDELDYRLFKYLNIIIDDKIQSLNYEIMNKIRLDPNIQELFSLKSRLDFVQTELMNLLDRFHSKS